MTTIQRIENWAKENPFRTTLLFYPISELVKFIVDKANGLDYSSLLSHLIALLKIDFNVKTWHVLLLVVITVVVISIIGRRKRNKVEVVNGTSSKPRELESSHIGLAKHPLQLFN